MNNFVPLRIVSCYSFLQSGLTMERIAVSAHKNGYFGIGLCDKGYMYGVPEFVKTAESIQVPYLIGMETSIDGNIYCLYVVNEDGYHNLIQISSALQNEHFDMAFLKSHASGLVCVLETNNESFKNIFLNADDSFNRFLLNISLLFKDGFYLGIEVTKKDDVSYANKIRRFANEHTYECVAFPKIRYQNKDDAIVLRIAEAIANEETLVEKKLEGQEYFMSIENYQKIYTKSEIANTSAIINKSSFNFHQKRGKLLRYPVNDSALTLKNNCQKALNDLRLDNDNRYTSRLNYELETIINLGYGDYFLIVQDYVKYAKDNNILVGPGRGSAAGSLVAYLLGITEIDPLKYDLQFERFLNPYRQTMPDIDVDFMDVLRGDVVEYVRSKYGNERVANIVTFQTIKANQSLRDIGRVYGFSSAHIDLLCKRIGNKQLSLREAYKKLAEFKSLVDSDQYFLQIVSLASKIEGLIRQSGLHPAGVILNDTPLEEALPVSRDFAGHLISQYEMNYLEEQGFLKMDFLALRNLTTIDYCIDIVNERNPDNKIDKLNIPFDDKETYELIANGQTTGVFQLESAGMRHAIKRLKPSCFNDVVALLALFRPGPMDSISDYAKRKEGKEKITYDDPSLVPILESTYGIIVYQEQVNQIATTMAGFTMGEADLFRRAISKKNMEKMLENEKLFIDGAIKNGHSESTAKKMFEFFKKFANYGFNKSHTVAYAFTACRMAYLKKHYPLEFYVSILETSSSTSDSKFNEYVSEMKKRNISLFLPDINTSDKHFVIKDNGLLFPLNAIHGINEILVNNILEERKDQPFKDFFDFVTRMKKYKISETQLRTLINAGSFDAFSKSRASLRASIISAMQYAELSYKEDGQLNIGIGELITPYIIEDHDDPLENLEKEYEVLGIMLSNNPLHYKKDILKAKNIMPIVDAKEENKARVAGLIRSSKTISTKKGTTMAFIRIVDETDEIEITVFPETYLNNLSLFEKNQLIVVDIKKEKRDDTYDFICQKITPLEEE